ncbi:uncharacterized protein TRUGW13939_07584 [Talaromyces rugulosus]|uniref:HNH nuclease domain-containing protein n=1 Tax=Talaromyces rugulosus TaxID=121627 RepID=A0A7H8R239_TALRU|nr:uncharacterized protein TRUGW13939_07584 [Talaromyces rugulosus]QKX60439.1 hypothetical protein TRUGW13939_07584 [Talaromyces rugulosus]
MSSYNENQPVNSSAFSELTKLEVRRAADNACWACQTPDTDVAHVIAQVDGQVQIWKEAALFNSDTDFKTIANGIALCPTCYRNFDNTADPGFIFFPTDLQFFIDFEINDQDRRRNDAGLRRRVPTAEDYKAHQLRTNTIPSDAKGGLYRCVFLKNFVLGGRFPAIMPDLCKHRTWHGNPIASLRRAFAVLGTPRVYILDKRIRDDLEKLRYLYFVADQPKPIDSLLYDMYRLTPSTTSKRPLEEEQQPSQSPSKKPKLDNIESNTNDRRPTPSNSRTHLHWVLGPEVTTNQVIQMYSPLFSPA